MSSRPGLADTLAARAEPAVPGEEVTAAVRDSAAVRAPAAVPSGATLTDRSGTAGTVESASGDGRARVRLASGRVADVPVSLIEANEDGTYSGDLDLAAIDDASPTVLREVLERVRVDTVTKESERVVARVVTDSRTEAVDAEGWRESVDVERVAVGRPVDAVEPPRRDGDVTVIPVYEEVLVVTKQLVLREEIRLTTRRERVPHSEPITLRRQHVEVDRIVPDDAGERTA